MKFIRVIKSEKKKSSLSESGIEKLKQVSTEVESKNGIAILKSNMTGNFMLFDYKNNDFVDDEIYTDIASAEKALEDCTESVANYLLADLADDLLIDIEDVEKVSDELSKSSMGNSGYGKIDMNDIEQISSKVGLSNTDVETIALELGYNVE